MKARGTATVAATVVLLLLSIVIATAVGTVDLSLGRTAAILLGLEHGEPWQRAVLLHVRAPRVLLAALAGGGLGVAGAAMQGLFRNPMADPAILGVSGGSALGAVAALYGAPAAWSLYAVPVTSFAGGVACAMAVYALATTRGHTPVFTLLLAGIAVGSIANALTSFVLSLAVADWEVGRQMLTWLMGSLEGRSWRHLGMAGPLVLGGTVWIGLYARDLNVMLTGEQSALSVGVDVARVKRNLVIVSALVTAATVAVMGIVAFVGLIVPHVVRLLVGPDHRRLLPVTFFAGGAFLIWADLATRALPVSDLRLGVVTALTGGPFFLYLLLRQRNRGVAA